MQIYLVVVMHLPISQEKLLINLSRTLFPCENIVSWIKKLRHVFYRNVTNLIYCRCRLAAFVFMNEILQVVFTISTAKSMLTLNSLCRILHLFANIPHTHSTYLLGLVKIYMRYFTCDSWIHFVLLWVCYPKIEDRSKFLWSVNTSSPTKTYGKTLSLFCNVHGDVRFHVLSDFSKLCLF